MKRARDEYCEVRRHKGGTAVTAVLPDRPDVIEATEDDLVFAVRNALRHAGLSADALLAQAHEGRFSNDRARIAWVAVGDLLEAGVRG